MDASDPELDLDSRGVCRHCRRAEQLLQRVQWTPEASEDALRRVADGIRRAGAGHDYDSIVGLSGGVDSSYVAYLAHRLGLRPLAVHLDNGWDSELAVENIQRVVEACGFDLYTYVIDWREFRDLQRAFLKASVVDIELLTDHAIYAALVGQALDHGVQYLLTGTNIATEHGIPDTWVWNKQDWRNIRAIHKAYGSVPLHTFPRLSTARWAALRLTGRIRIVELLNLVPYRRDEAAATLARELGWREYGGKHHESLFTKFYQGAILPTKFGIDKRRVHLSDRVRNGEMTREDALKLVEAPLYDPQELRVESEYVRKKLGFQPAEWAAMMATPRRSHADFPSDRRLFGMLRKALRASRAIRARVRAPRRRLRTAVPGRGMADR